MRTVKCSFMGVSNFFLFPNGSIDHCKTRSLLCLHKTVIAPYVPVNKDSVCFITEYNFVLCRLKIGQETNDQTMIKHFGIQKILFKCHRKFMLR